MDWFVDAVDRFIAAVFVAVFAVAASQAEPFAAQYAARTAADLREADGHLKDVRGGVRYQTLAAPVRADLETKAVTNLERARGAHAAVAESFPLLRPLKLWQVRDTALFRDVEADFVPAVPATTWTAIFALIGALIGFAVYEIVKWPVVTLSSPKRRRFRKRN